MANNSISNILSKMGNGAAPSNQVMRIAQQPKSTAQSTAQNTPNSDPLTSILSRMSGNPDTVSTIRAPQKSYQQRVAEGEAKYQERAAQQEEADAKVRGSLWDMIGNAAAMQNARYLPVGQQLDLARRQMQAANDFTTGLKESKEAAKAFEWDGRDALIEEYKKLDRAAYLNPKMAARKEEIRKELETKDALVGNGERAYSLGDRTSSAVGSFVKGTGSSLTEFAADAGQAIAKASVNQQILNENQFLVDQMLGEDTMARYNQVNAAMNSEEGQRVWNQMYSVADSLGEGAARDLNRAKNGLGAIGRAGVDIGVNVLQMGFDAGVGALTGGSSLVPMFVRVAGESMREARLEGVSLERRLAYGVTKATIEVATEKMFDGVAKLYGKGAMDDIVEVAIRRAASTDAGKSMLRILAGASGEAIEEVASGLLDPLAEAVKTGKIGKLDAEEMAYSAFIGFCIGFLGSGGNAIAGGNAEANAELRARDAMYAQMQNQPSLRQEIRDMGILSKLQSDPNYYQNLNTNNTDVAMEALSDAGRASELQQAQFAAANSQVQAIEERYGVKHDDGGRFVTRNGQKIYSPTTVQELQVYLLLTQTDMTRAEAETIAKSKAYSDAFARLTGIEMTSDYSQKLAAIQNAFQKAAETQEASGGTETSPSTEEAATQDSDELNSQSESEKQGPPEKKPKIGPKRGRDVARQAYAEDTIAQETERQERNAEADVENNAFNEDFEAEDMQLQRDAAETTRRAEEAEAKRAADANRPGPIGPKRAAQMDREANAEADQARAEAREEEAEAANVEGDFDEDAAIEQYAAEQQAAAEAAAEAERKATYEERRKAGQLTEQERAEAKSTAEAKRSEQTSKRLTELSKWAKSWASRWTARHGRHFDPGTKQILHGELAKAIEGFANGTTTAAELSEIYDSLNAEDATADSKYFYEPDVAQNLKNLVKAEEELTLAQESGAEDVTQEVDALYHQAEQAISNLQTKLDRLDKLAGIRSSLFGELSMESKVKGHGIRQQIMHFAEMYLKTQSRIDTMFRFFGGFNEQASNEWYKLANRSTDAERRFITTGYNARSFFYLLQSQSPEMAKAWSEFEGGKLKGNVDVPGIGKMSLNYELSLLRTLETSGGITHIAGNGFETAYEPDYYKGQNNNGWGNNAADHNTVDVHAIQQMALPFLEAEDSDHPTAEEWMAARVKALENLRSELKADVMASPIGKAAYEASEEAFKYLAREVNKTSVKMFGYEKATNTDYYPLEDASSGTTTKAMSDRLYDMNNPHFLQRRVESDQALKIKPFAETMMSYIQEASNWAAFADLWSDMQILDKTMNHPNDYPTLAGMVNNAYGNYAKDYLSRWERVISNNRPKTSAANKALGAIRKNIAQASLTLNPGVALKQTPSYFAAAGVIDPDILIKSRLMTGGIFRTAKSYQNNPLIREVNSRTGALLNRLAGYNTIEMGESLEASRTFGQRMINKLPKWMTNWITGRDVSTVSNLAIACGEQVKRNHEGDSNFKVGSDEYYDEVASLLEEVIVKTQPIYDPQFRAEMLRSDNEVLRSAAMFKTQPSQDFNQLYTAIAEASAAKRMLKSEGGTQEAYNEARRKLHQTMVGQFVAKAAFSALSILSDLLAHRTKKYKYDKKDEEKNPEHREGEWSAGKFLTRFLFGTASSAASVLWFADTLLAVGADIITGVSPLDDTSEFYSISEATVELINNGVTATISFAQAIGDPNKNGWQKAKAAKEAAVKLASMKGIPLQNAYNMLNTVVMYELDNDKTKNFDHNDDFMRSMSNYSQLSDTAIARKTMDRAAISFSKGKLSEAESLLATLNFESNDIISAVASSAKESYISGTLTEKQYRTILKDYCKKKTDDVNKAVEDAGRDIAYNAAKEKNEKGFEAAETLIKAATDKRRDDDRPRDYYVMDSILTSTLTDKEKDVTVATNLSKEYRTNYNILRNAGMSSAKTAELLEAIDKNSTGSIDQDELYEWYLGHKADEKKIAALFNAKGYEKGTLTWAKFIDNKKNMPYDEVKLANEDNKKFNQLDEYAKQLQSDSRIIMQKTDADQAIYSKIAEMGLKDEEFDAAVQQYISSGGKKAYNAARNEGYTPDKTVALIKAIDSYYQPKSPDSQNNGSLSIAEIMAYLREHPDEETVLKSIYYASTTSNKSWEEQKKKAKIK